jgi:hypothetical protein
MDRVLSRRYQGEIHTWRFASSFFLRLLILVFYDSTFISFEVTRFLKLTLEFPNVILCLEINVNKGDVLMSKRVIITMFCVQPLRAIAMQ